MEELQHLLCYQERSKLYPNRNMLDNVPLAAGSWSFAVGSLFPLLAKLVEPTHSA